MNSVIMLPAVVVLVVAFALAIGIACTLQYLAGRRLGVIEFAGNEFSGVMLGMVSTLYALVLGFITVMVWQGYNGTAAGVATETAAVADVWHSAVGFPTRQRTALRREMLAYAQTNAGAEWSLMRVGESSPRGDALIMEATETAGTFIPVNQAQSNAQLSVMRCSPSSMTRANAGSERTRRPFRRSSGSCSSSAASFLSVARCSGSPTPAFTT